MQIILTESLRPFWETLMHHNAIAGQSAMKPLDRQRLRALAIEAYHHGLPASVRILDARCLCPARVFSVAKGRTEALR